uniref:SDR family NAD(P)-dependent oxidoreductase n=1 Tax=Algoriphagus sp. TaxID=1872435 RepID=UPI004047E279
MNIAKNTLSIVTGATGGLGKEISKSILVQNGKLVFVARDEKKIKLFGEEINDLKSGTFYTIKANLQSNDDLIQIEASITEILKENAEVEEVFLFNNASTIDPIALIEDVSFEQVSTALIINIASAYALTAMLLRLKQNFAFGKLNIINISSGVSVNAVTGWSSYCISKAGLNMLSKCIATESSDTGVFSVSINPGPINTGMQEKIRNADAEKIPATRKFETMYTEGKLQGASAVTEKIFRVLASNDFSNGDFIDFNKLD